MSDQISTQIAEGQLMRAISIQALGSNVSGMNCSDDMECIECVYNYCACYMNLPSVDAHAEHCERVLDLLRQGKPIP